MVILQEATAENIHEVWKMQIKAFEDLLQKYQDHDMSPGAEPIEKSWRNSISRGQNTTSYLMGKKGLAVSA